MWEAGNRGKGRRRGGGIEQQVTGKRCAQFCVEDNRTASFGFRSLQGDSRPSDTDMLMAEC